MQLLDLPEQKDKMLLIFIAMLVEFKAIMLWTMREIGAGHSEMYVKIYVTKTERDDLRLEK